MVVVVGRGAVLASGRPNGIASTVGTLEGQGKDGGCGVLGSPVGCVCEPCLMKRAGQVLLTADAVLRHGGGFVFPLLLSRLSPTRLVQSQRVFCFAGGLVCGITSEKKIYPLAFVVMCGVKHSTARKLKKRNTRAHTHARDTGAWGEPERVTPTIHEGEEREFGEGNGIYT